MRILVAEDDRDVAAAISADLTACGHAVEAVVDGRRARILGETGLFDVAVLDRRLPGQDGMDVLRAWRARGVATPAILVTALGDVADRIEGLAAGADDYLPKPFDAGELRARIAAVARRTGPAQPDVLETAGLTLDLVRRDVAAGGRRARLKPRECGILAQLMRHAGRVVTRRMLLESVWGYGFDPGTNIVDSHVCRLRSALSECGGPGIETLRGLGYRLAAD